MYDLLIKDGTVMDGSGNPWFIADVAITGRRIERIGRLGKALARRVINASGLAVAPGFVDCHRGSQLSSPGTAGTRPFP
jgi:N-acyl-D-aspartate/D-glutamate deacylase